jgi:hypothetical protein
MNKLILLFLAILVVLTGCASQQGGSLNPFGGSSSSSGVQSLGSNPAELQMQFVQEQPPSTIYNDQEFTIMMELTNKAECDVKGDICVFGTLTNHFGGLDESCQSFDLRKLSLLAGKPDQDSTSLLFGPYYYTNLLDRDQTDTIKSRATYSCQFSAGPQICIKENPREYPDCPSVETIKGSKLNTKPAPVTLTQVVKRLIPTSSGTKVNLELTFKKVNSGSLVDENEEPKLNLNAELIGFGSLTCLGDLTWKQEDTEKVINCHTIVSDTEYVESILNVDLSYIYQSETAKTITIKREEGVIS